MEPRIDGDAIAYADWRVPIAEIRVIGEFLTQHGRRRSEHFLVFMTREEWFKAPYYADGREAFITELARRLGHPLRSDLLNATNFSSRVLWPAHLEGQPLFELHPEERASDLVTRVRQMLIQKVDMRFTDEVRKQLGHA